MNQEELRQQYEAYRGIIKYTENGGLVLLSNNQEYEISQQAANVHLQDGINILHRIIDQHNSDDKVCEVLGNILPHYNGSIEINYTHNEYLWTPIMSAMQRNFVGAVQLLLEYGANVPTNAQLANNFGIQHTDVPGLLERFGIEYIPDVSIIGLEAFDL